MRQLFDFDGKFMSAANRAASLMWLGVLVFLGCVPIVTAGASLTAMYYTVFQMREKGNDSVLPTFWRGLKGNFVRSTLLWLPMLAGGVLLWFDFRLISEGAYTMVYRTVTMMAAYLFLQTCLLTFPMQVKFENSWLNIVKNSFALGVLHLPRCLIIVAMHLLPFLIAVSVPVIFPVVLVLGVTAPAYFSTAILLRMFHLRVPKAVSDGTADAARIGAGSGHRSEDMKGDEL